MNVRLLTIWLFLLSILVNDISQVNGLFDPLTGGTVFAAIASALWYGYGKIGTCKREECCEERWRNKYVIQNLRKELDNKFYGQHIAAETVVNALSAHVAVNNPPKALTMSFHGLAGSGKNYLAALIVNSYYKKARNSAYYHFFNGRTEFPLERNIADYKEHISDALYECPESIFVFDEVDMMPPGVLNAIVPFLDYSPVIHHDGTRRPLITNKAIYIFLSNAGSQEILKTLTKLWQEGKSRTEATLGDFENDIFKGAFNEKGGFHMSDTISNNVIDHYVPFLPMEQDHVILCIKAAFQSRNYKPTREVIEQILSHVTYGPEPYNIYAKSGCKRLEQKVASIVYRRY